MFPTHTFLALVLAWSCIVTAIKVTSSSTDYTVDAESSNAFVVAISRSNCDITSLLYRGVQYQYSSMGSHLSSGLGSGTTVSHTTKGDHVIVKCVAKTSAHDLTHYMVFTNGESTIHMGTQTNAQPAIGELRFIFRLVGLKKSYPASEYGDVSNTASGTAIEGSDVFKVGSETRSKFYSSERFIDDKIYCATDDNESVHACWLRPNNQATEKSSGGPFFRDINLNWGGEYHSVTYYMNSGHTPTEAYRQGFHGPYVFSFSRSGVPKPEAIDVTFFESLGLTGYIGRSGRGQVKGTASGIAKGFPIVLHWYNAGYQGWAYAASNGAFSSPPLVAGSYTMKLYQDEFLAATSTVLVTAGTTLTVNIAATNPILTQARTKIFQLGDYDGKPTGFLNADKQPHMHPSDARMSNWKPAAVSASAASQWPMALFKSVNDGQSISFSLPAAINAKATLRIATTLSFSGGRPQATVNDHKCDAPEAPTAINSRGVTRGATRGFGDTYTCSVPVGKLVKGSNKVSISIVSGSSGASFLSPSVVGAFAPVLSGSSH